MSSKDVRKLTELARRKLSTRKLNGARKKMAELAQETVQRLQDEPVGCCRHGHVLKGPLDPCGQAYCTSCRAHMTPCDEEEGEKPSCRAHMTPCDEEEGEKP